MYSRVVEICSSIIIVVYVYWMNNNELNIYDVVVVETFNYY